MERRGISAFKHPSMRSQRKGRMGKEGMGNRCSESETCGREWTGRENKVWKEVVVDEERRKYRIIETLVRLPEYERFKWEGRRSGSRGSPEENLAFHWMESSCSGVTLGEG